MFKACIGLNCTRQIDFIDRRHCGITFIPEEIYRHEQNLEELLLDYNTLQELPSVREGRGGGRTVHYSDASTRRACNASVVRWLYTVRALYGGKPPETRAPVRRSPSFFLRRELQIPVTRSLLDESDWRHLYLSALEPHCGPQGSRGVNASHLQPCTHNDVKSVKICDVMCLYLHELSLSL